MSDYIADSIVNNEVYLGYFTDDDKVFLGRVKENLLGNKELSNKIENNSRQNVKAVFGKYFNQEMTKLFKSNRKFYKRLIDNDKLKDTLMTALFDIVYFEHKKTSKSSRSKGDDTGVS